MSSSIKMIRSLLPADSKVLSFIEFIKEYAPSLNLETKTIEELPAQLIGMIIAPTGQCNVLHHVRSPDCREPVRSLIDDVVWLLIQRRTNLKRTGDPQNDGRNALLQGFVEAREGEAAPSGMRLGVAKSHPNAINENVGFCKTSVVIHKLHSVVGDDIFRLIFTHTRLFFPVSVTENDGTRQNIIAGTYILLCGPPLPIGTTGSNKCSSYSISLKQKLETAIYENAKRKKRRKVLVSTPTTNTLLHANDCISRFALFYVDNYTPHVGLPKTHLLKKNPPCSPHELFGAMFNLPHENKNKQRRLRKRLGGIGCRISQDILRGHSRCDYHRLLTRYCPLPHDLMNSIHEGTDDGLDRLARLSHAFTPQQTIVSFLGAILRRVFPSSFWGSEHNFQCVMSSVNAFVHLRRRERLANKTLMHKFSVTHVKWLYSECDRLKSEEKLQMHKKRSRRRTDHETATKMTLTTLRWIFQGFIIPLLRTNWVVSETEFSAQQMQYYRRPVWALFRSLSFKKLLGEKHFTQISYKKARELLEKHQLGVSRLRLVPKATGVRPIAQLSRRHAVNFLWDKYIPLHRDGINSQKSKLTRRRVTDVNEAMVSPGKKRKTKHGPRAETIAQHTSASSAQLKQTAPRFLPTNLVLRQVLDVLRFECLSRDRPYGSGIDSLELFYLKYRDYIVRLRQKTPRDDLRLVFASVDIEKCFDRINQETLLNFVQDLISHNSYVVQQLKLHRRATKSGLAAKERGRIGFKKLVDPLESHQVIHSRHLSLSRHDKNCVVDLCKCALIDKTLLLSLLQEHVKENIVVTAGRFHRKIFIQTSGISQGSTLSTTLCNIYYGRLEGKMLYPNEACQDKCVNPDHFVSRFVDDFLFVGTDHDNIRELLSSAYRGVPELGALVNRDKTVVSSAMTLELGETIENVQVSLQSGCRRDQTGRCFFPWCGLLFDTETGGVSMDYARFYGEKLIDSMTVDCAGQEGSRIQYRMQGFVFPRCLPILFDISINSFENTITNYFQMMLFAAVKSSHYLTSVTLLTSKSTKNRNFVLRCIQDLPTFAARSIRSRSGMSRHGDQGFRLEIGLHLSAWLTWKAFLYVFSTMEDYKELCREICKKLRRLDSTGIPNNKMAAVRCAVSRGLEGFSVRKFC